MALTYGAAEGNLQVGIDTWSDAPSAGAASVWVYVRVYVRVTNSGAFNDNQTYRVIEWDGDRSGGYHNGLSGTGATQLVYARDFAAEVFYGFGQTFTTDASISGMFNNGTPSHQVSLTLAPRPPSAPGTPEMPSASSITATTAELSWPAPAENGSTLDRNSGQVSRNSAFTDIIQSWDVAGWATSRSLTGLPKGTQLYARIRAHNGVDWSPYSSGRSFFTGTTAPGEMSAPTVDSITATVASVNWFPPTDSGGATITHYEVQRSESSSFTSPTITSDTASPTPLSGLLPGTTYYVRVRAVNPTGAGAFSPSVSFQTLSGVKVGNGTAWRDAIVWLGDGSAWVMTQVKRGNGSTWI